MKQLKRLSMRRIAYLATSFVVAIIIAGGLIYKARHKKLHASNLIVATLSTTNGVAGSGNPVSSGVDASTVSDPTTSVETSEAYFSKVRSETQTLLDLPPSSWSAPSTKLEYVEHALPQLSNSLTPEPDEKLQSEAISQHHLVRPVPYPFYRTVSVPSDCCGSAWQDYFYTHTLLSRKYGLDLPASFFGFSANSGGHNFGIPAVFSTESLSPKTIPLKIESQEIDSWVYFLTNYYRGWIDHLHSWTDDSIAAHSLVTPTEVKLNKNGQAQLSLERRGGIHYPFIGLVLDVEQSSEIEEWQLELTDHQGLQHVICWGTSLAGRAGWELTQKSPAELKYVVLPLDQEQNRSHYQALGRRTSKQVPFEQAKLNVKGTSAGTFRLNSLRVYQFDHATIAHQLDTLRQFNVLPCMTSYHGGSSSWGCIQANRSYPSSVPLENGTTVTELVARSGEAGDPRSPSYHTDLLRAAGIHFLEYPVRQEPQKLPLEPSQSADGLKWWTTDKPRPSRANAAIPPIDPKSALVHFEDIGHLIASHLQTPPSWGGSESFYTHYNFVNKNAIQDASTFAQMYQFKRLSAANAAGFQLLSNAHYNWSGDLKDHQRVWAVPASVRLRHLRTLKELANHTVLRGNRVEITPWTDTVTDETVPHPQFPTLDLHGQTFYVPDRTTATVVLGDKEIKSLKRNPADFTGRESVTIIDTSTPLRIFDELDLYEHNGRLVSRKASYFYRSCDAYHGHSAMQIRANETGTSSVRWEPIRLECHETQFLRFAYRKDDLNARFELSWKLRDGTETVVTDGELGDRQGWQIPAVQDKNYHEVVLDFADLQCTQAKKLPRGAIASVSFVFQQANAGNSIWFDQIEFLSARGVRPHDGQGVVLGGKLHPARDGETVKLSVNGITRETTTRRGGWYWFTNVPVNSVVEILSVQDGRPHYPLQGRLLEATRNDLECHIFATDRLNPSVPRPTNYAGQGVTPKMAMRISAGDAPSQNCAAVYAPHAEIFYAGFPGGKSSYLIDDQANNYGWTDKDRDEQNPDNAIRICLQGECWTEGLQSYTAQRMNIILESILRQKLGVPVEVIKDATSSSSPASYSERFEKYGVRFKPDMVLMFVNPFNMAHMEPTMARNMLGWDKAHSPYRMYDFDPKGNLVQYPADPGYGAFQETARSEPLLGVIPLYQTFAVGCTYYELASRTFDLLRGVLNEAYRRKLAEIDHGNKPCHIGLIHGYCTGLPLSPVWYGNYAVVPEHWRQRVNDFCQVEKLISLDLTEHLQNERTRSVIAYEHDGHPSPMGQYLIASALASELLKMPELNELVEQRRSKASTTSKPETASKDIRPPESSQR